jgi:hypothetical protein
MLTKYSLHPSTRHRVNFLHAAVRRNGYSLCMWTDIRSAIKLSVRDTSLAHFELLSIANIHRVWYANVVYLVYFEVRTPANVYTFMTITHAEI